MAPGPSTIECPSCSTSTSAQHFPVHFKQTKCRRALTSQELLRIRKRLPGAVQCAICWQVCKSSSGLTKHQKSHDSSDQQSELQDALFCTQTDSLSSPLSSPGDSPRQQRRVTTRAVATAAVEPARVPRRTSNIETRSNPLFEQDSHQRAETHSTTETPRTEQQAENNVNIHYAAPTVPQGCTEAFSEAAAMALEAIVDTCGSPGQEQATAQRNLLMLPSRLLGCSNGSRRRQHKVLGGIKRYLQGQILEPRPLKEAKKRSAEQQVAKQVHKHLAKGNVSRAARALEAQEVAEATVDVVDKLETLHPAAQPPVIEGTPNNVHAQIPMEKLKQVISRLPKGSAPGPSGWTFEHIKTVAMASENGMNATHSFINSVLAGNMPDWPEFRASRLIPLKKPGGGIRPIAIGEVWARLASMCAMACSPEVGPGLAPLQLGVGIRGGAQCMGHAINAAVRVHPDHVVLQLDAKNAFNTLSRQVMLEAVLERAPKLAHYALWMYTTPSPLHLTQAPNGRDTLWSRAGVRQGDPCGPLFFALAMQGALEQVNRSYPDVQVLSYLDDVFLHGPAAAVEQAYRFLERCALDLGLVMQPAKSTVYSPNTHNAHKVGERLGFRVSTTGIVAAGCPIGEDSFVSEHAKGCAQKVVSLVDTLQDLRLAVQDRLLLLRKSLQVKCSHLARCCEFKHIQEALHQSEKAVLDAVLNIIDREETMVDIGQLRLPTRKGGIGLQCLTSSSGLVCKTGYIAAAALTQKALSQASESLQPFKGVSGTRLRALYDEISAACTCAGTCKCDTLATITLEEAFEGNALFNLQHATSQRLADKNHSLLLDKYRAMSHVPGKKEEAEKHLARLLSLQHPVATAWLSALPTKHSFNIDDHTVKSALKFMLGVSPGPKDKQHFECACADKGVDSHHAMTCNKMSGLRTWRHNLVQNSVRCGGRTAGLATTWEPKERYFNNAQPGEDKYGRRGDILMLLGGDCLNVDIAVTHPAKSGTREKASKEAGAAATQKEKDKIRDHETNGTPGYRFVPFIVETCGRLGPQAEALLKELAEIAASTGKCEVQAYMQWMRKEISVSLIRGNRKILWSFASTLHRGCGQNHMPGDSNAALQI